MINNRKRTYDLEDRTLEFAKRVLSLVSKLPRSVVNIELTRQIARSSGSVGANYREANEALGKKDFTMRVKICRKEAKETRYWQDAILHQNHSYFEEANLLIKEATEFIIPSRKPRLLAVDELKLLKILAEGENSREPRACPWVSIKIFSSIISKTS